MSQQNLSALIWSVADLLRGDYKQSEYGKVILPFTILRRLDCVLAPTKQAVLEEYGLRVNQGVNPFSAEEGRSDFLQLICVRSQESAG